MNKHNPISWLILALPWLIAFIILTVCSYSKLVDAKVFEIKPITPESWLTKAAAQKKYNYCKENKKYYYKHIKCSWVVKKYGKVKK